MCHQLSLITPFPRTESLSLPSRYSPPKLHITVRFPPSILFSCHLLPENGLLPPPLSRLPNCTLHLFFWVRSFHLKLGPESLPPSFCFFGGCSATSAPSPLNHLSNSRMSFPSPFFPTPPLVFAPNQFFHFPH